MRYRIRLVSGLALEFLLVSIWQANAYNRLIAIRLLLMHAMLLAITG